VVAAVQPRSQRAGRSEWQLLQAAEQ
jgi:hypothetical protein